MLIPRVLTAVVLLALLFPVLWSGSFIAFSAMAAIFFAVACWEGFRLFRLDRPYLPAAVLTLIFAWLLYAGREEQTAMLFAVCVAIWAIRLTPALAVGLPPLGTNANRLLSGVYGIAILGCFMAIASLYFRSPLYLLSVLVIVWVADIGAYFVGKTFGRRRLAPSISPGKTWEGAIGGWISVVAIAFLAAPSDALNNTFPAQVLDVWGWAGLAGIMTLLVAASIVGDLFESQLKRRADMKDSSRLLPGHGGVLDRVDALIPVLPLAALVASAA